MSRPTFAQIDFDVLSSNLRVVRDLCPKSKVMAVVKADAYGHGAVLACKALSDADAFAVASIDEALLLRNADCTHPICILSGFGDREELELLAQYSLTPVIHSSTQLEVLSHVNLTRRIDVWVKIDSGMHRLGFPGESLPTVLQQLRAHPAIGAIRLISHLANAEDTSDHYTTAQLNAFRQSCAGHNCELSLANSAGLVAWPETHMDWVRPGIMLYGVSSLPERNAAELGLRPAMTFRSAVIAVKQLKQGDRIGYGGSWTCPEAMSVAVIACGYGDGYPRHAVSGTPVLICGRRAPVVGRISMDLLSVDLRRHQDVTVGTPAVLWGAGLPVEEVARWVGTNAYQLLCSVTARVPRI
ncbi:MAG: alanine racemase [Gammaproteobacteria bacterium]|nr:alanine racemase [Gammaproteobacteria bacterium]